MSWEKDGSVLRCVLTGRDVGMVWTADDGTHKWIAWAAGYGDAHSEGQAMTRLLKRIRKGRIGVWPSGGASDPHPEYEKGAS